MKILDYFIKADLIVFCKEPLNWSVFSWAPECNAVLKFYAFHESCYVRRRLERTEMYCRNTVDVLIHIY